MHEVRSSLVLVSMLRRERLCRATHNDFMINTNMNVMMKMKQQQQRWMVGRASNRSGVHGSHLPRTHSLDVEGVQKENSKGKKGKSLRARGNMLKRLWNLTSRNPAKTPSLPIRHIQSLSSTLC